jgi:hypothetical protein
MEKIHSKKRFVRVFFLRKETQIEGKTVGKKKRKTEFSAELVFTFSFFRSTVKRNGIQFFFKENSDQTEKKYEDGNGYTL